MNKYIAIIGPGESMPGGMLEVIHQILQADMPSVSDKRIHIPTASKNYKIVVFLVALIRITWLCLLKRLSIAHINMSERGSVKRTNILLRLFSHFDVKTIVHSHGGEIEKEYNEMTEDEKTSFGKIFDDVDAFIVLTEGWKHFWQQIIPEGKIYVISNGVVVPKDYQKEYKRGGILHILFMGYIGDVKGTYDLIRAVDLLKKQGKHYQLVIAGNGEIEKCKEEIEKKNLSGQVEVVGWISGKQKEEYLRNSDIFVLPSHFESFGIAALEAMARKLPVICGDKGYTKEIITDGETGFVAITGDEKDIANKIITLDNTEMLRKFGENAYRLVVEKYSINSVMRELEALYSSLQNMKTVKDL